MGPHLYGIGIGVLSGHRQSVIYSIGDPFEGAGALQGQLYLVRPGPEPSCFCMTNFSKMRPLTCREPEWRPCHGQASRVAAASSGSASSDESDTSSIGDVLCWFGKGLGVGVVVEICPCSVSVLLSTSQREALRTCRGTTKERRCGVTP